MHYYLVKSDTPLVGNYFNQLEPTLQTTLAKLAKKVYPGKTTPPQVDFIVLDERSYELQRAIEGFLASFEQHLMDRADVAIDRAIDRRMDQLK